VLQGARAEFQGVQKSLILSDVLQFSFGGKFNGNLLRAKRLRVGERCRFACA
jgi:hypothetical protein